jgi:Fic family protein
LAEVSTTPATRPEPAPAGHEVPIVWRGRRALAFVPTPLAQRDLALTPATVAHTATAAAELGHAAAGLRGHEYEPLARLLLRAEGVASSYIEGVRAPVVEIVLAEHDPSGGLDAAGWVAANLAAVSDAVASSATELMSGDLLRRWHRTLMTGSPTPQRYVGEFRTEQGWIGGHDPTDAHLVTPPVEYLPGLLDDLVAYANRDDVDPVAQAAVVHAQFEIVHPFADGNGRVGRILAGWLLGRRLSLLVPPPLSVAVAADVGGYAAGLTLFRFGDHNSWVSWFADTVRGAGESQLDLLREVERLQVAWRTRIGEREGRALRSDAAAWRILDLLPSHLVLTTRIVSRELGLTTKAAKDALDQLAEAGVLLEYGTTAPHGRGRPSALYVSTELLGLTGSDPLR